ncbi:MAG: helix-turn-helix domain-containing protein [Deltaproteobacteria bacterium]|nr:helix-turn-helix domain-containing protein [Deltaproteobacteria bacterium]
MTHSETEWAAICSIAEKLGCGPKTLRKWLRQAQRDAGERPGLTTARRRPRAASSARAIARS